MGVLGFSTAQRRSLEAALHRTREARVYRRLLAILEVDRGTAVYDVARLLQVTPQTVYNWLARVEESRRPHPAGSPPALATALRDAPRGGRPAVWTTAHDTYLQRLLHTVPDAWGYLANEWTVPLLREQVARGLHDAVSDDTIRRALHQLGYVWHRSRYRLAPDPEREKKTRDAASAPGALASRAAHRPVGRGRDRSLVVSPRACRVGRAGAAA